jgi:hypothetical protein
MTQIDVPCTMKQYPMMNLLALFFYFNLVKLKF